MIALGNAIRWGVVAVFAATIPATVTAQERLPWEQPGYGRTAPPTEQDPYSPRPRNTEPQSTYERQQPRTDRSAPPYEPPPERRETRPYNPEPRRYANQDERAYPGRRDYHERQTYSENEILNAGHHFFGSVSAGLARAIARLFKDAGRPNGYILGEDAGGAFVAGLRYGEGTLYTKTHGARRIYWQGPSLGYDFGGEGSRTMTLIYDMRHPDEVYGRFGGVQGSAYVVGGVGVQLLKRNDVTLAPIRSGVGLRLGANIGYLKYTRRPTWNPF
jgi:hypothetical protein